MIAQLKNWSIVKFNTFLHFGIELVIVYSVIDLTKK